MDDVLGHINVDEGGALIGGEVLHMFDGPEQADGRYVHTVRIYRRTIT